MVSYTKEEIVGVTDLAKSIGTYIDKLISNPLNKIAITRRNKMEAVIVPIEEYEHIRQAADYLEDLEITKIIEERVTNRKKPVKMLSLKELKKNLRDKGKNV